MKTPLTPEQKAELRAQMIRTYRAVFESPDGQVVLDHIRKSFGAGKPVFLFINGRYDNTHAAKRDGQLDVIRHIEAIIEGRVEGAAE